MAVISLEPRGGGGGRALVNTLVARTGTSPRTPRLPSSGTNNTATTFSRSSNHSPRMDAVAVIIGVGFVLLIAGGLWLFNHYRRLPNSPPSIVEKNDRIPIFKNISEPVSRKAWQSKLREKDASMASQDSCAICLEPVNEKDDIRPLPCNHIFHLPCFDQWFWRTDQPNKCPLCRAVFVEAKFPELPEQSHIASRLEDSIGGSSMN